MHIQVINVYFAIGNINGNDQRVYGVERDREQAKCTIDPSIFEIPRDYVRIGKSVKYRSSHLAGLILY